MARSCVTRDDALTFVSRIYSDAQIAMTSRIVRSVLRVLQAGNGRSNRCEVADELTQRLITDGVVYTPEQLSAALIRLEDCGLLQRVQRTRYPSSWYDYGLTALIWFKAQAQARYGPKARKV